MYIVTPFFYVLYAFSFSRPTNTPPALSSLGTDTVLACIFLVGVEHNKHHMCSVLNFSYTVTCEVVNNFTL